LKKCEATLVDPRERIRSNDDPPTAVAGLDSEIDRPLDATAAGSKKTIGNVILPGWNFYPKPERDIVVRVFVRIQYPNVGGNPRVTHANGAASVKVNKIVLKSVSAAAILEGKFGAETQSFVDGVNNTEIPNVDVGIIFNERDVNFFITAKIAKGMKVTI
jgi:hypothetical protein